MPWAKLDESFPDHPKVASIGDKAFRLHVTAICYCARMLTDGEVPAHILQRIGATKKLTTELAAAGLWEATSRGSWVIHDFLEYNPSRAEVEADRSKRQAAGQAGGKASGKARAQRIVQPIVGESLGTKTNPVPTRTVTVPSNEATVVAATATAPRRRAISDADVTRWEGEHPAIDIKAFVADYLNWTGSSKHQDKVQGFENQLRITWKCDQFRKGEVSAPRVIPPTMAELDALMAGRARG
jgi:hypothetical protein